MLYPRKIQILKLADAGAHVLIPALAVPEPQPQPGKAQVPEGVAPSSATSILHLLCGLKSLS